jgi:O-antigen ligase
MLLFFGWLLLSAALSSNKHEALRYLDPRFPLLFFPLSIGLIVLDQKFTERVLLGFAILITCFCLACLGWSIRQFLITHNAAWLYNDALTSLTGQQSIYISLLVNIAIYIYSYFIFYKQSPYKGWMILATLLLFCINYLLASRNQMLTLYLSVAGFIVYYILKEKKYLEGATLVMGGLLGLFMIYKFFPKTLNRFRELTYTSFTYNHEGAESRYDMKVTADQWNGANFRIAAWNCGWELFLANPFMGVHLGDKKDRLFDKYREKDFRFALETKKNLHNNYLDILVATGFPGLLLFLGGWLVIPLFRYWKSKNHLALLVAATLHVAMFTEVYFDRSIGGMLVGLFIPLLLSSWQQENQ